MAQTGGHQSLPRQSVPEKSSPSHSLRVVEGMEGMEMARVAGMEETIMKHYTPKRLRPLKVLAMIVRFIVRLLKLWPLLLIVMALLSPITPHVALGIPLSGHRRSAHPVGLHLFGSARHCIP